ncbi:MAG: hypothetical protein HGA31_00045 [Candidatus Moranbacteria bacterium]|nr:hypothetical protein [Candidatus Moranbacteria bacterium]
MFWEQEQYPWGDMTNPERIGLLRDIVFPRYSEIFVSHEPERKAIREKYNVAGTLKFCSDPRIGLEILGIYDGELGIKRGIGSVVPDADPLYRAIFSRLLDKHEDRRLDHLYVQSWHFSESDKHKCCAGQHYDRDTAENSGKAEVEKMRGIYRTKRFVYPILIGIETDRGEVTFHGYDGSTLKCSEASHMTDDEIYLRLHRMYRDSIYKKHLPESLKLYILDRLIRGNIRYMAGRHAETSSVLQKQHQFVLGLGSGFFTIPRGRVLIIPPFPMDKKAELLKGAELIRKVLKSKRIRPENGFILSTSTMFDNPDDESWAAEESLRLMDFAAKTLEKEVPDLYEIMGRMPLILDRTTRETTIIG